MVTPVDEELLIDHPLDVLLAEVREQAGELMVPSRRHASQLPAPPNRSKTGTGSKSNAGRRTGGNRNVPSRPCAVTARLPARNHLGFFCQSWGSLDRCRYTCSSRRQSTSCVLLLRRPSPLA